MLCVSGGGLFYTSMMEEGREVLKKGREGWSKEGRERDERGREGRRDVGREGRTDGGGKERGF